MRDPFMGDQAASPIEVGCAPQDLRRGDELGFWGRDRASKGGAPQGRRPFGLGGAGGFDQLAVQVVGQRLDALAQAPNELGQIGVLLHQLQECSRLGRGEELALFAGVGESFAMLSVRFGVGFVPIGLSRLREENERRGVGGLRLKARLRRMKG